MTIRDGIPVLFTLDLLHAVFDGRNQRRVRCILPLSSWRLPEATGQACEQVQGILQGFKRTLIPDHFKGQGAHMKNALYVLPL